MQVSTKIRKKTTSQVVGNLGMGFSESTTTTSSFRVAIVPKRPNLLGNLPMAQYQTQCERQATRAEADHDTTEMSGGEKYMVNFSLSCKTLLFEKISGCFMLSKSTTKIFLKK